MANYNSLKNAALIAPTTNPDLGSANNRYGNVYLSGNVNIAGTSLTSTNALTPRISSIVYGTGAKSDDTATDPAGGTTITINGTGFNYGASVYVSGIIVSVVSVAGPTQITFTSPAKIAGNYSLAVVNPDGASALYVAGLQYSGVPTWTTTAGDLGAYTEGTAFSATFAATSDSTVTYSIASGTLPSGITLNSTTGFLSGTMPSVAVSTTYNFTVRATDTEKQDTDRNFSVNVATAPPTGQVAYTTAGTYSWTAPAGVTSVSAVAVGGGGAGYNGTGGSGGGLGWKNSIAVTPGQSYAIVVGPGGAVALAGNGGDSYFINSTTVKGGGGYGGGGAAPTPAGYAWSGQFTGDGGCQGGLSGHGGYYGGNWAVSGGGGGAGGYQVRAAYAVFGAGADSDYLSRVGSGLGGGTASGGGTGTAGTGGENGGGGGGGADWNSNTRPIAGNGGGVGILGQGTNGAGGSFGGDVSTDGTYGGNGTAGSGGSGQTYGGGGGARNTNSTSSPNTITTGTAGAGGAVRIIWGAGRAFPSTLTTDQ